MERSHDRSRTSPSPAVEYLERQQTAQTARLRTASHVQPVTCSGSSSDRCHKTKGRAPAAKATKEVQRISETSGWRWFPRPPPCGASRRFRAVFFDVARVRRRRRTTSTGDVKSGELQRPDGANLQWGRCRIESDLSAGEPT